MGRDGRTRLARANSQARTGTAKYSFPCLVDNEQDWQPYPVDPYSAICDAHAHMYIYVCMYGHTYSKGMDQPDKVVNPARGQLNMYIYTPEV